MKIQEINDKNLWEQFISAHSPQSLFQSWNWGEVTRIQNLELGIKNLWRLGLFSDEKLIGIAQVVKITAKRGIFACEARSYIFRLERKIFTFFLDYLKTLAKDQKALFIRISPLIDNSAENQSLVKSLGFQDAPIHAMDGEYCWVLDLDEPEEQLLAGMRKTTRYLIKQAQKIGVVIKQSKNTADLAQFLKLYSQTADRHNFVPHKGIREEFSQLLKDNQICLFQGYYQSKLLCAALIVFYNHQAIYHHSASVEQRIPVNYLLQWEVIKEAKRRGKSVYNFWGWHRMRKKASVERLIPIQRRFRRKGNRVSSCPGLSPFTSILYDIYSGYFQKIQERVLNVI